MNRRQKAVLLLTIVYLGIAAASLVMPNEYERISWKLGGRALAYRHTYVSSITAQLDIGTLYARASMDYWPGLGWWLHFVLGSTSRKDILWDLSIKLSREAKNDKT